METQKNVRRIAKLGLSAVRHAGSAALPVVRRLAEPLQRKREQDAGRESHPAGPMPSPTASDEPAAGAPPAARVAPPATDAPAPVAPPAQAPEPRATPFAAPDHVDRGATLVRESVDPGAADHVGAQIHVKEPWDGYEEMRAVDIVEKLGDASAEMLAVVRLYEQSHRDRVTVVDAIDRRLAGDGG